MQLISLKQRLRPAIHMAISLALTLTSATTFAQAPSTSPSSSSSNLVRNPNGGYTHRTVEIPPGSRILYISGQTATDADGKTPNDGDVQAEIVYQRIAKSLADAGMTMQDLVKTTVYLTDAADLPAVIRAGRKYNPNGKQAGTLVYVKALATPEARIEIEAVAAQQSN
jgi:enamine deaminase RidA (YjgF/YER057c/UK114 family)